MCGLSKTHCVVKRDNTSVSFCLLGSLKTASFLSRAEVRITWAVLLWGGGAFSHPAPLKSWSLSSDGSSYAIIHF